MINEASANFNDYQRRQADFFKWGLQYYIAGRFAWFAFLMPIGSILFHHAVEMLLKGNLLKNFSEENLDDEFKHNLHRLWNEFKKDKNDSLDKYEAAIQGLNKWDDARYPPLGGYTMYSDFKKNNKSKAIYPKIKAEDQYRVNLEEMDELVKIIFDTSKINPAFFGGILLKQDAREFYYKDNEHLLDFEYMKPNSITKF